MKTPLRFLGMVAAGASFAIAQAQSPPIVMMVTDVQGPVSIVRQGTAIGAILAAEVPAASRIEVGVNGRLSLLELSSGDELQLTGPVKVEVRATGVEADPRDRLARKSTRIGPIRVREEGLTRAAFVLRSSAPIERLPLVSPANTVTLQTRPRFRWKAVEGVGPYRFELTDEKGSTLHEIRTESTELSLPEGMALVEGGRYSWEVSARRPDGIRFSSFTDFSVASRAARERADAVRPARGAPVSEWTAYAVWLDGEGLAEEARGVWVEVARARPDDPMARKLAGP